MKFAKSAYFPAVASALISAGTISAAAALDEPLVFSVARERGGLTVTLRTPLPITVATRKLSVGTELYDRILISGGTQLDAGLPDVPVISRWVAIPVGAEPQIRVIEGRAVDLGIFNLAPVQPPLTDSEGPPPAFVKNLSIYARDSFFPGSFAEIAQRSRLRGQPMVLVEIHPYQYNPVTGRLLVYPDMAVEISTPPGTSPELRLRSQPGDIRLRRLDPTADAVLSLPPEQIAQPLATGFGDDDNRCEFLIICDPAYEDAANRLAAWRMNEGMSTVVATTAETGSTTNEIQSYISNAYNTWPLAPAYCLLLGDSDTIPVVISDEGIPTDFHYGEMDGDLLSEIAMGRWPVRNADDANRLAEAVIAYESGLLPESFYSSVMLAAAFQDGEDKNPPEQDLPVDGYAERRFAKTAEDLYHGFISNGLAPQRIYATYDGLTGNHADVDPTNWSTNNYYIFENDGIGGEPLPDELLKANGFLWDGDTSNITAAINSGCVIAIHRDHAAVGGWSSPAFYNMHADALTNAAMRPVVFSIDCLAGNFTAFSDSLCERFLWNANGGAIGCVGSTEVSFSGRNDRMALGWMDAIWPGFLEDAGLPASGGGAQRRMGDIFNTGREHMLTYYSHNENTKKSVKEFHWLGDPTLKIWTEVPKTMDVFCPHQMPYFLAELPVEIPEVEEASVVATLNGRIIAATLSTNDIATLRFPPGTIAAPDPGEEPIMTVTVFKEGYLTVTNSVLITREHLDHYVSLTGGNIWPYTSWETAAHSPQDAINAALPGDFVFVTNGVYETGGRRTPYASQSNRVYVSQGITLKSINGPEVTKIRATYRTWDDYRAAYVTGNGVIDGFTLYDGSTAQKSSASPSYYKDSFGGNAYIYKSGTIRNCIIKQGLAYEKGGNVMCYDGGTVADCTIFDGQAFDHRVLHGDNAYLYSGGTITNCIFGDAGSPVVPMDSLGRVKISGSGRIYDSVLRGVEVPFSSGGRVERCSMPYAELKAGCTLVSCLITNGNYNGTGLYLSSFYGGISIRNCTVADCETAISARFDFTLSNTILARNEIEISQTETNGAAYNCRLTDPEGYNTVVNCISAETLFTDPDNGDFTLLPGSPCVDAGDNDHVLGAQDLNGDPRIMRGTVDIGAYEANHGLMPPAIEITDYETVIGFDREFYSIGGTHNGHVVGAMEYWRLGHTRTNFTQCTPWTTPAIPIPFGDSILYVKGTNLLGQSAQESVEIHRLTLDEVQPFFAVTNAASPVYIDYTGDSITLSGTNHSAVAGDMIWFPTNAPSFTTSIPRNGTAWSALLSGLNIGFNPVMLVASNSYGHTVTQQVDIYRLPMNTYVSLDGSHTFPFDNWGKAATNIQEAVDATCNFGTTWVSNGTYRVGEHQNITEYSTPYNRVVIERPLTLRSLHGKNVTFIDGENTVRGAYLSNGAILSGMTITNCFSQDGGFPTQAGGIYADSGATITNCIVTHCTGLSGGIRAKASLVADTEVMYCVATGLNGGMYVSDSTSLQNCSIHHNTAANGTGGVAAGGGSNLFNCEIYENETGGSVGGLGCAGDVIATLCSIHHNHADEDAGGVKLSGDDSLLDRCTIHANTASGNGGGVYVYGDESLMRSCLVTGNTATNFGGGILLHSSSDRLYNCTVSGNHAEEGGGIYAYDNGELWNFILYGNTSTNTPANGNWSSSESGSIEMHFSCTSPTNGLDAAVRCLEADPLFTDPSGGDFRLLPSSPCINAATNETWMATAVDLDGNARVIGTYVDMGAYEALRGDGWPFTDITNTVAEVLYDIDTFMLAGTNNSHAAGSLCWSNTLNGASSFITATPAWSVEVPLAVGSNLLSVTVTNLDGVAMSDSHSVVRLPEGSGTPVITITNTVTAVEPDDPFYILAGIHNGNVVGMMAWTNEATWMSWEFNAANPWFTDPIMLMPGDNLLIVSGTNSLGVMATDSITVRQMQYGDGTPEITITTPDQSVPKSQATISVNGFNNIHVVSDLVWSNALSGASGTHSLWIGWPITDVALAIGTNVITVSGENLHGEVASDSVTIIRNAVAITAYVDLNGSHTHPFNSWPTASTNIQDALNAVGSEGLVIVSNGTYESESSIPSGHSLPCRIVVPSGAVIRSVNGPELTVIRGSGPLGPDAVRCAYLESGALLSGFTLENGATFDGFPANYLDGCAGGVWAHGGSISNCIIRNCHAVNDGGGVMLDDNASIVDSIVELNTAGYTGGGIRASFASISRCSVVSNSVSEGFSSGGGIYGFMEMGVTNCLVVGNTSGNSAGGIYAEGMMGMSLGMIVHCTIAHNTASGEFSMAGGVYGRSFAVSNSIIYHNSATFDPDITAMEMSYAAGCCTPATNAFGITWSGCITNPPLFAGVGDYHLAAGSPCIDAVVSTEALDLRHARRPWDGDTNGIARTDIGCYECGHPTFDSDGDGMSDADELTAGTDPDDPDDYFRVTGTGGGSSGAGSLAIGLTLSTDGDEPPGVFTIRWPSAIHRHYTLFRTNDLSGGFTIPLKSNIPATPPENVETDPMLYDRQFYRITVEE